MEGFGHPFILIHGYTADSSSWGPLPTLLAKHFQVLRFDNRGVGRTIDNNRPLTGELMADDIIALADALQLKNPYIAGASMGGTIAQHVGIRHGNKISKLIIMASVAKWRKTMLIGLKSLLTLRQKNVDFDVIFEANLPWVFGEHFLSSKENIAELKQLILSNPYPQTLPDQERQFKVLEQFDSRTKLHSITAPTLVIQGEEDLLALRHEGEHLATMIPNSQFIMLPGAHILWLENTELLASVMTSFLKA